MARVRIIPIQQFELLNSANSLGTPTVAYHDVENGTVIFDTTPNTTLTYRLIYRYMPAEISDFDAVVVFPNDSILIQAIYCWALQYEDDDRYAAELTVLDNMISRYRRRFGISPDVNSKMAYNPATFNNIGNFR
jgi:adenylate kinase family enzyme